MLSPTPIKPNYQSAAKFAIVKVDSPIKLAVLDNGPARCYRLVGWLEFNVPFQHQYGYIRDEPAATRNSSGDRGVGNYSLEWLLPPLVLPI